MSESDLPPIQSLTAFRVDGPATVKPRSNERCSYRCESGVQLNQETRSVECRRCGEPIDPFDALLRIADRWDRWAAAAEVAKAKIRGLNSRIAELERKERNAKARVRRANAREATP